MTDATPDLSLAERIDAICDQFEQDFRAGKLPQIESCLGHSQEPFRSTLLRAVMGLEIELRQKRGETPRPEEYLSRFPNQAEAVREVFSDGRSILSSVKVAAAETSKVLAAASHQPPTDSQPLPMLGRFQVLSVLGEGAFGTVYKAHDPQLDRDVAIKVPRSGSLLNQEDRDRFLREARAAAGLHHAQICPVHEVGTIDGRDYIVMAFIDGKPLSKVIQTQSKLSDKQVVTVIRKIALALQEAHEKGIIHRDLKPANVMINRKGEPVIMDFGLARRSNSTDAQISHSGQIMGTPAYMSPEQARGDGKAVGPAADIYSLGVMFYELLCGQRPFAGTITEVIGKILHVAADPPSKHRPDLDPRLEALCLKAIAKDPAQRFASMKDVAAALADYSKEPEKPAAAVTKSPVQTTAAPANVTDKQRNIQQFIQQGQLPAALEALKPLLSNPDQELATWAKEQTAKVKADIKKWQEQLPTLTALGHKLIRKCDYAEAKNILLQIPAGVRPPEIQETLQEAEDKQEECDLLQVEIEEALRKERPKELPSLVKRFLQLKPGHKAMQKLAEDLKQYGPERAIKIHKGQKSYDIVGSIWDPKILAAVAGGLAASPFAGVYFAVIFFQTPRGTVVIHVHDPAIVVKFDDDQVTMTDGDKSYRLKTTEKKTLSVDVNGATIDTGNQEITVSRNQEKQITARLLPDQQLQLTINGVPQTFAVPGKEPVNVAAADPSEPPRAIAPFDAVQAKAHQEAWAKHLGVPVEYTNSIGMKFRLIPPGEFLMGSTEEEIEKGLQLKDKAQFDDDEAVRALSRNEMPQHRVVLTRPFYLGIKEVTQSEYEKITGSNPAAFSSKGSSSKAVEGLDTTSFPIECVSWNDVTDFATRLSQMEKLKPHFFRSNDRMTPLKGNGYRLPTEAEWEFACRAGTTTGFWTGDDVDSLSHSAWFRGNSGGRPHETGELPPNPLGIHDMHGNVWEYVQDSWDEKYYQQFQTQPAVNPQGPETADPDRIFRGGDFRHLSFNLRSSFHQRLDAGWRFLDNIGFRVALSVEAVKQALTAKPQPPATSDDGFVALFNGKDLSNWTAVDGKPAAWKVEIGYMEVVPGSKSIMTREQFPLDFELHVEFWLPKEPNKQGQARANSGVYLHGRHEIQICDGFQNSIAKPMTACGALYGEIAPSTNACTAPETWQTYDITYRSPRVDGEKKVTTPGRLTVIHNGTKVIDDATFEKVSVESQNDNLGQPGPILLQDRGSPVRFRNIRLRPLNEAPAAGWQPLFPANDLAAWKGRKDVWSLQNGKLTGKPSTVPSNTFLFSPKEYRDFELRFQVRAAGDKMNSGVQIRSVILDHENFSARGPQCDIGNRTGDFWGGLYGEQLDGWLLKPDRNPTIKPNDFNDYFIRCVGRQVTIQVNGETTVSGEVPSLAPSGLLAFQVHRGNDAEATFRNIEIRELNAGEAK